MVNYKLTKKAVEDLSNIWKYTYDNWSENQADIYYNLLIESFNEICNNPNIGKNYPEVVKSLKGLRVGRHIVFYIELEEHKIEIIRILHEQMDLKNRIIE